MKAATAAEMRRIDERAIGERGIPGIDLMEAAGKAVARAVLLRFPHSRIAVVCGKGNNGGDGFVAARELAAAGRPVSVLCADGTQAARGDAATAFSRLNGSGVELLEFDALDRALAHADVIVDALLGTGGKGAPEGNYLRAIERINQQGKPVVSIDVPSGVSDGYAGGAAMQATFTVTIGLPKVCLLTWPGLQFAGEVIVEPIQFPSEFLSDQGIRQNLADLADLKGWLPARPGNANKGTFGRIGIIAGSASFAGAAILATRAALRTGSGLAHLFTPPSLNAIYKVAIPEAVTVIVGEEKDACMGRSAIAQVEAMQDRLDALLIGPGIGLGDEQRQLLGAIVKSWKKPLVLDADALNLLATDGTSATFGGACVMTPHPGEMGNLLRKKVPEIESDRFGAVRELAKQREAIVVLKGASPLVAQPDGQVWIVPGAVPALAKGGTGDVLAGVIASLLGQGVPVAGAAVLGVWAHLEAGKMAANLHGSRGVLASEVADVVPLALEKLEGAD